jgi:hypothetical protein
MSFQNVFAFIFISCGVELPNPNVLISTARGDLLVSLVPINTLDLDKRKNYLTLMSLKLSQELVA